mmetsp:Transcript_10132/g.29728  ORF Transcript_10132/g.29728 Transcript_10132/m.29728 type:complete len:211 (-) Transcript_10132:648-1280(-)
MLLALNLRSGCGFGCLVFLMSVTLAPAPFLRRFGGGGASSSLGGRSCGAHRRQHHLPSSPVEHASDRAAARRLKSSPDTPKACAARAAQPPKTVSARGNNRSSRAPHVLWGALRKRRATSTLVAPFSKGGASCTGVSTGKTSPASSPLSTPLPKICNPCLLQSYRKHRRHSIFLSESTSSSYDLWSASSRFFSTPAFASGSFIYESTSRL